MNRYLAGSFARLRSQGLALVIAAWLSMMPVSAWAGTVAPRTPAQESSNHPQTAYVTAPLTAARWSDAIYRQFEKLLSSRAGMLQFGTIMMILALAVIWWRRT
jgi:hypothetical protein